MSETTYIMKSILTFEGLTLGEAALLEAFISDGLRSNKNLLSTVTELTSHGQRPTEKKRKSVSKEELLKAQSGSSAAAQNCNT